MKMYKTNVCSPFFDLLSSRFAQEEIGANKLREIFCIFLNRQLANSNRSTSRILPESQDDRPARKRDVGRDNLYVSHSSRHISASLSQYIFIATFRDASCCLNMESCFYRRNIFRLSRHPVKYTILIVCLFSSSTQLEEILDTSLSREK